ncbi:MAG TPA: pyridoxamine 5'-phosphate oxidase family protein [Paludibacter sp.]|nr:pyridoxamine 5'-phosphate oxidase family protein [Paludibacter sp.]
MRRLDKKITDEKVIDEILLRSDICRLGLIDNGEAYIVPVNYAYKNNVIYIHSAHAGRKMELLKQNNRVSFEIEFHQEIVKSDIACAWTTKYRSVMGKGTITIENDAAAKKTGMDLIMRKYGVDIELNYKESVLERMTILMLKIESITGKQSGDW